MCVHELSGYLAMHLYWRAPPSNCVAIVPNMMSMKKNKIMTSNIIGSEFRIVDTRLDIFGI